MESKLLSGVPLFSSLSDKELNELAVISAKRKYAKDEFIIMQGDEGGSFFIILSGRVKVLINSPNGREVTLAILSENDYFGEMSLIDGSIRSASVAAMQNTELLTINHVDFNAYLIRFPEVSIKLLKSFMSRLRSADRQIEHLALHSIKGRLARLLLDWVIEYGNIKNEAVEFELPYTQKEIAGMLAANRESVTRMFTELKEEGYLSIDRNHIQVLDLDGLRKFIQ